MDRRHLAQRYDPHRPRTSFWRGVASAAALGFVAGFLLGVATGHFVLALVPAAIFALVFAALSLVFSRR